mmetsp:Transcript_13691/g.31077  ORF Transcript_13691/g.31077 Transcript_13691/m.31077 type:complete len:206 (+) Transcript_13691:698-1315(+)
MACGSPLSRTSSTHSTTIASSASERSSSGASSGAAPSAPSPSSETQRARPPRPSQREVTPPSSSSTTSHSLPARSVRSAVPSGWIPGTTGRGVIFSSVTSTPKRATWTPWRPSMMMRLPAELAVKSSTSCGGAVSERRWPGTMDSITTTCTLARPSRTCSIRLRSESAQASPSTPPSITGGEVRLLAAREGQRGGVGRGPREWAA